MACWATRSTIAVDHRRRQPPTAAGDAPHRRAAAARPRRPARPSRSRRRRACASSASASISTRSAAAAAIAAASVGTSSLSTSTRSSRCTNDDPWCAGVDGEHADVAAPGERPSPTRSGQPIVTTVAPSGSVGDQLGRRSASRSISSTAARAAAIGSALVSIRGAQPPQRAARRVALDDAPAGDDEPGRVEPEPAQRAGGLPHERLGVGTPAPGPRSAGARSGARPHGTDGGPGPSSAACWGPVGAACYRRTPWRRTHRWTSCWPRSVREPRPLEEWLTTFHLATVVARPVHQRELVDPADRDAHPRGAARVRRPGQLPRHRRRATTPARSSVRSSSSSSCSPIPTAPPSRRSA